MGQKIRKMFFIDGFDLGNAIERATQNDIRFISANWLDLKKLCSFFIDSSFETLAGIKYFTTLSLNSHALNRQKVYISALLANHADIVDVIYGKFERKTRYCANCASSYTGHEENLTGLNISICLLENALNNNFDEAIIVSSYNNLIPAILAFKRNFPEKTIAVLPPFASNANDLKNKTDKKYKMAAKHLHTAKLESPEEHPCPAQWDLENYTFDKEARKWFFAPKS